ncbi:MAG: GNAT family N-acetyltransferase [Alcanivorax sp.]|nr:GNAT family N-acetyltransferase [Alcanivorax sp.]
MAHYPFLRAAYLNALADTGAVGAAAGWHDMSLGDRSPGDLSLESAAQGWMPLYAKDNPWGEYVFDHQWAHAYQRYGLAYYPKLITAVPYTPVPGPRWQLPAGQDAAAWLWPQIQAQLQDTGASGWHLLFPDQPTREALADLPLISRQACHFRWFNRGYADFDGFLDALVSRKRKGLRRERRRISEQHLRTDRACGNAIPERWWDAFYACYASTYLKRGQAPYLSQQFFRLLAQHMPEQLMMSVAFDERDPDTAGTDIPVAAALYLFDDSRLYGRYWGALRDYDALHFELCYYQGIEFSIERGLNEFDPGVQGEHKLLRGFEPVITWSLHHLVDRRFHDAIGDFCRREAAAVAAYREEALTLLPFRDTVSE